MVHLRKQKFDRVDIGKIQIYGFCMQDTQMRGEPQFKTFRLSQLGGLPAIEAGLPGAT